MTEILLSKKFTSDVINGNKVSTIRRGRRSYPLGDCILKTEDTIIPITITKVRYCKYKELTEEDAINDGFSSLAKLQKTLSKFYPDMTPEEAVTIIEFRHNR